MYNGEVIFFSYNGNGGVENTDYFTSVMFERTLTITYGSIAQWTVLQTLIMINVPCHGYAKLVIHAKI